MKKINILQTADEVIDAFQPVRLYGDDSPWVGVDAKLDFSTNTGLVSCDTCEIRGVTYGDIVRASLKRLHVNVNWFEEENPN